MIGLNCKAECSLLPLAVSVNGNGLLTMNPLSADVDCAEACLELLMSTAVSSALVVKLDFSPAPASDAAAALAPTATATAATMVASLSAAAFLQLLINAAASAITAAMKFVRRHRT